MAPRNYKDEYKAYQGKPEQRKRNDARKAARRKMEAAGVVKRFDGLDVDHKSGSPMNNAKSNLRAIPKSVNRSYPRTKTARKINTKD